jgi:hypothetical protein
VYRQVGADVGQAVKLLEDGREHRVSPLPFRSFCFEGLDSLPERRRDAAGRRRHELHRKRWVDREGGGDQLVRRKQEVDEGLHAVGSEVQLEGVRVDVAK